MRDATACVDSIPLISSSIMSKKLASGADGICLDVKVGSGAFMKTIDDARLLAQSMVDIGKSAGKKMVAVLTNMDEPLGRAVGNTLEVIEAVESLKGNGPKDFMEVVYALGIQMLLMAEKCESEEEARHLLESTITSKSAYHKFCEFVEIQGGNPKDVENISNLLEVRFEKEVYLDESGYVSKITAEKIGHASMILGGGRASKEDDIDLSVGVVLRKKVGDKVGKQESVATVYANDEAACRQAIEEIRLAYSISQTFVEPNKMILEILK